MRYPSGFPVSAPAFPVASERLDPGVTLFGSPSCDGSMPGARMRPGTASNSEATPQPRRQFGFGIGPTLDLSSSCSVSL
jgi:hypothetical protein